MDMGREVTLDMGTKDTVLLKLRTDELQPEEGTFQSVPQNGAAICCNTDSRSVTPHPIIISVTNNVCI